MSSDISKEKKSKWNKFWIQLHQKISHKTRVRILSEIISTLINSEKPIKCLDVGCGDMQIAEQIEASSPQTIWTCLDIYKLPETLEDNPRWKKYRSFDGIHIPFNDLNFDYILLCDVLHHSEDQLTLLKECSRVSERIIIKDHYQYGFFSNLILKWMDKFGNQAYGVKIPGNYFSEKSFQLICKDTGLRVTYQQKGIQLYNHLPIIKYFLRPEWQFIAVLEKI